MDKRIRFLTKNDYKFREFEKLFDSSEHGISKQELSIEEIQTEDMEALVKDKVLKAFDKTRRPLFVDHTGLQIDLFGGFPGGLTELFWERLGNKKISELVGCSTNPGVTAVTQIGYCDGRNVMIFRGELRGIIAPEPRGQEGFQWDPVFIPDGHDKTFAEMGDDKNNISMRRRAIDHFIQFLDSEK